MLRKILIAGITFFGVIMVSSLDYKLFATSVTYNSGGSNIYGRVNMPPSDISSSSTLGMQKGDRVYLGINNPYDNTPLSFQLILYDKGCQSNVQNSTNGMTGTEVCDLTINGSKVTMNGYTDYTTGASTTPAANKAIKNWYSLSNEVVAKDIPAPDSSEAYFTKLSDYTAWTLLFSSSNYYNRFKQLKTSSLNSESAQKILAPRNLQHLRMAYHTTSNKVTATAIANEQLTDWKGKIVFPVTMLDLYGSSTASVTTTRPLPIKSTDLTFSAKYTTHASQIGESSNFRWSSFYDEKGVYNVNLLSASKEVAAASNERAARAAAYLNMDDVVFAVTPGSTNAIANIKSPALDTTSIWNSTGNAMKVRVYNSNMTADLVGIEKSKIVQNSSVTLNVNANNYNNSTISAMIFQNNKFVGYRPLGPAGDTSYVLDTTGLSYGSYKVAIVNEIYDETKYTPADSSLISQSVTLEIVRPLSIAYTNTPQTGASVSKTYEYSKNVKENDIIGRMSFSYGIPDITYKIVSDPTSPEDYKNFKLDKNVVSSGYANISIDANGPDYDTTNQSLKAGTYKFCVNAINQDEDANSMDTIYSAQKCGSIVVNKTSPNLTFTDAQDRMIAYEADYEFKESISHQNMETIDPNFAVTFSTSNFIVSVDQVVGNEATLKINNIDTLGDSKLIVTIAETENYVKQVIEKNLKVYQGMSLSYEPVTDITTKETMNAGFVVGSIKVQDGKPNYIYSIDTDPTKPDANEHGNSFELSETSSTSLTQVNIKNKGILTAGTYKVTVKVIDDTPEVKYLPIEIVIQTQNQSDFKFYDYRNDADITNKVLNLDTSIQNAKLIAKGGNTKGITYKLTDGENKNVIQVDEVTGQIQILGTGRVKVEASIPGNAIYSSVTIYMYVEITQAELPDFTYTLDGVDLSVPELTSVYAPQKYHQLGVKDAPDGSSVRWKLDADENGMIHGVKIDDVVSVNETSGLVTILNANLRTQTDVKIIATMSCPGYTDKELDPILVTINQAPQNQLKFAQTIYQMPNGKGSFSPRFKNGASSDDGSAWNYILKCEDVRVVVNNDTYSYHVNDTNGAEITIKAINKGNRNYLQSAEVEAKLRILKPGETLPNVEVTPSRLITYGESISLYIRDSDPKADYTFESMDETILAQDAKDETVFHSKNIGDSVLIKVTKSLDGYVETEDYVSIQINPKPVEVELKQSYTIKTGEAIPAFEINDFKSGDIINNDVLPKPTIKALVSDTSKAGSYPITITYPNLFDANKYDIKLKKSYLIIEQDHVDEAWIKVYEKDDATKTKINENTWYHNDIVVELIDKSYGYDQISRSNDKDWSTSFLVSDEGNHELDVYFRNSTTGSISDAIKVRMKIDKTAPSIPVLSIDTIHQSAISQIINMLTFGSWMNQGVQVTMTSEDSLSGIECYAYKENKKELTSKSGIITYGDETNIMLQAKACDVAGNCSEYSQEQEVLIDLIPPVITGAKNQSEYKQYYLPRVIKVRDVGSGVKSATYTKNKNSSVSFQQELKVRGEGVYTIYVTDYALNTSTITFKIIPLPDIETEIDGSDVSKEIIDQVEKELDEMREQLTPDEIKDYEQWIEDATKKWEDSRKKIVETDDKASKIEGIGDTDFDTTLKLIVEKVNNHESINLPRKAIMIYDVFLKKGNSIVQPNGDIKVYLPYTESAAPIVYQIDKDGTVLEITAQKEGDFVTFVTNKLMRYAISNVLQEDTTCKLNGVKLNIDTDGDQLPDINLDLYDANGKHNQDCSADLNIDINDDGIPDLNIDTTGDGESNINIDVNADGKADVNLKDVQIWKPDLNAEYQGFSYDTMEGILPDLNIDVNGDRIPDFNIDSDGDGIADTNLLNPDQADIKEQAIGGVSTGDHSKWLIWFVALIISLSCVMITFHKSKQNILK